MFANIVVDPGKRLGAVFEKAGKAGFGEQPVIRQHHNIPATGQRSAGEGIMILGAVTPSTTIDEHDDRKRFGRHAFRRPDIEPQTQFLIIDLVLDQQLRIAVAGHDIIGDIELLRSWLRNEPPAKASAGQQQNRDYDKPLHILSLNQPVRRWQWRSSRSADGGPAQHRQRAWDI